MLHVIIEDPRRCHHEMAANWRAVSCHCPGPWIYLDKNHYVVLTVIKVTFRSGLGIGQDLSPEVRLRAVPYLTRERWLM